MANRRKGRSRSTTTAAIEVARIAVGEIEDPLVEIESLSTDAAKLGQKGGLARASSLSPERRSEIARKAAKSRWMMDESKKKASTDLVPQDRLTIGDVDFIRSDERTYTADGRWGRVLIDLSLRPDGLVEEVRLAAAIVVALPDSDEAEHLDIGLVDVPDEDFCYSDTEAALRHVAYILVAAPAGMFRYIPFEHQVGSIVYRLKTGLISQAGCILNFIASWHGEEVDRRIEIAFSQPLPHIQSWLETHVEQDKELMRLRLEEVLSERMQILKQMKDD